MKKMFTLGFVLGIVAIYGANAELVVATDENEQVVVETAAPVVTEETDVASVVTTEDMVVTPDEVAQPVDIVEPIENPEPAAVVETVSEEIVSE